MFLVANGEYLTVDLIFSKDRRDAAWLKEEHISKFISRFRLLQRENNYLSIIQGGSFGCSNLNALKEDDSTLFLRISGGDQYESIFGQKFEIERHAQKYFLENGFLVIPNAVSSHLVDAAKNKILSNANGKTNRISNLFALDKDIFANILQTHVLRAVLELVFLSKEFHLTTYSSNTLFYDETNSAPHFHVDYPYHMLVCNGDDGIGKRRSENELLGVQVVIPLTDFNFENGATLFIPNSFLSCHDFKNANCCFFLAPKGSIILYRADLIHSQGVNKTEEPRVALLANFAPLHVPAKDNILEQALNCGLRISNGKVFI
jgi:ectoine hydroxylase-related dioxygenase (phytanoyl-CoA dioxygenase family)